MEKQMSIRVRLKDGTITEYVRPINCTYPWYDGDCCWGFANNQDKGKIPSCSAQHGAECSFYKGKV